MNNKRFQVILLLFGALVLGFIGAYVGMSLGQTANTNDQNTSNSIESQVDSALDHSSSKDSNALPKELQKIAQTFGLIKENYIEDVEDIDLIEGAIEGMLATLEDPHTSYLNLESMEEFNQQIESSFQGIGAEVSMINGVVTIVSPIKDSPAERAGLRPNDQVLSVDDESLEGLNLNEAVAKIRGEKGTEVTLEIMRASSPEPFKIVIVRDDIPVETVYSETEEVDGKVTGIIQITNFSENTGDEFAEQLEALEAEGMDGLVIDVRGNPGGLLNVVEEMVSHFIPEDKPYLQIEHANGEKDKFYSNLSEKKEYPISVLINEGSASASEILAVALQENGYDIVGHTSYGKGTVQTALPLGDGSSIKMTTYKWLSPNGEWIDDVGVVPTIEVDQPEYYYANPVTIEDPLGLDDTSPMIANVQVMLDGLGYEPGRLDGYLDAETEAAIESFQADNDLDVTGVIDQQTAGMIDSKIIEKIRSGEDDLQLEEAINALYN